MQVKIKLQQLFLSSSVSSRTFLTLCRVLKLVHFLRLSFSLTICKVHVLLDALMLLLKTTPAAKLQPRCCYDCRCRVDATPVIINTCCLGASNAASSTEVRFFCCYSRRRCMFLSCTHDVLIVGCDSFRSSFILDTRFSSPSSFFYCTFMFL